MFHAIALLFHHSAPDTAVRATLGDGQILMGEVQTRTLRLQSGAGLLEIPLADVGEVVPASGDGLGASKGRVDVWLRNGSELRGTWADPELDMTILVGGADVPIELPMNDLSRFQLQGGTRWPDGPVYRMRTAFGDDFLVDPARTTLVLENDLGTFSPLLSECQYVAPVDDPEGPWRVQLQTGTVLVGHLANDSLTVALPMGPAEVQVPLAQFVSLNMERWAPVPLPPPPARSYDEGGRAELLGRSERPSTAPAEALAVEPRNAAAARADDGWFDHQALQATKDASLAPSN